MSYAPTTPDADRLSAVYDRHVAKAGLTRLTAETFDEFVKAGGDAMVFFAEDPKRVPETWDVAVLLADLLPMAGAPLRIGMLLPADAQVLASRFSIGIWPALLFMRDGGYVGTIEGMRDWSVFARDIPAMLARPVTRAPGIGIPVATIGGASSCH